MSLLFPCAPRMRRRGVIRTAGTASCEPAPLLVSLSANFKSSTFYISAAAIENPLSCFIHFAFLLSFPFRVDFPSFVFSFSFVCQHHQQQQQLVLILTFWSVAAASSSSASAFALRCFSASSILPLKQPDGNVTLHRVPQSHLDNSFMFLDNKIKYECP
jgi:hypothetical protein